MNSKAYFILTALGFIVATGCAGARSESPLAADSTTSPVPVKFIVSNPSNFDRPNEFIRFTLSEVPPDWQDSLLEDIQIVRTDGDESVPLDNTSIALGKEITASGEIQSVEIVFVDSLAAHETRTYEAYVAEKPSADHETLTIDVLNENEMGDLIRVQNGEYTFLIGHELEPLDLEYNGQLPRNLYIRLEDEGGWAKLMPLSHLYFNIPEYRDEWLAGRCEHLFIISPGLPRAVNTSANELIARVQMEYSGWAQAYCGQLDEMLIKPRPIDFYHASVELTFYRDLSRVDAHTEVVLDRGFYNHNGFAMGGVETDLERPRVLFGDSNHTLLQGAVWEDTEEETDRTEFMQIEDNRFVFRRATTRDAGAPFEILAESDDFHDYYVVEGQEGKGVFAYFPDFSRLAYQNSRDEGTEVLPVNMIGAGPSVPLMVPNPIILSQSHLGNIGDVWVPIAPGRYSYDFSADLSVPFDPQATGMYDNMADRLGAPLEITLLGNEQGAVMSTVTPTVPPPSTSTPVPSPTPTPTPAPKSCDPPARYVSGEPLISGSYFEHLAQEVASLQDGWLVVDNTNGDGWLGGETRYFRIPGPFSVRFSLESRSTHFYMSGRGQAQNPTWWGDGIQNIYFQDDGGIVFWDGRAESSNEWLPLGEINEHVEYKVRFLEPCGKQFEVYDVNGNLLRSVDVTRMAVTKYPNGLFPDGVVSFGLQIDPGGWMSMSELYVELE